MTASARPTGTPWLRLDPRSGWRVEGTPQGLVFGETGFSLGQPGRRPIADTEPFGSLGGRTLPTGLAIAPSGRVFLADPVGRRILTYVPPDGQGGRPENADAIWPFSELWPARDLPDEPGPHDLPVSGRPADPYTLIEPRDVALAPNCDLAIVDAGGDSGVGRVLVIALPSAAIRQLIDMPGAVPLAIGFDASGRAYVADTAGGRILRFDALWRADDAYHSGQDRLDAPRHLHVINDPSPATCGRGGPGCACKAEDCGCLADGTVLVANKGTIVVIDPNGHVIDAKVPETLSPPPLDVGSNGAVSHHIPPLDPLILSGVEVTRTGVLTGTNLALVARPKRVVLPRTATLLTQTLGGGRDGFPWHRITIEADIPERTRLIVQTHTSDDALEPNRVVALTDDEWSVPLALDGDSVPEVLVQSPGGRWMWLRVQLFGDGEATPLVRGIGP